MKVFNLQCVHGHPFEGWFKDLAAYEDQREGGLLECPYCGSREVEKTLSAPRLNLSGAQEPAPSAPALAPAPAKAEVPAVTVPPESAQALVAAMKIVREALSSSEDVGARFAEEARAMHSGEAPSRSIHGQTSLETARELAEEGIPVLPLPFANLLKSSLQ
jgi:hypothetical protein